MHKIQGKYDAQQYSKSFQNLMEKALHSIGKKSKRKTNRTQATIMSYPTISTPKNIYKINNPKSIVLKSSLYSELFKSSSKKTPFKLKKKFTTQPELYNDSFYQNSPYLPFQNKFVISVKNKEKKQGAGYKIRQIGKKKSFEQKKLIKVSNQFISFTKDVGPWETRD